MTDSAPLRRPRRTLTVWLAAFAGLQGTFEALDRFKLLERFHDRFVQIPSIEEATRLHYVIDRTYHAFVGEVQVALATTLAAAYVAVGLGFLARFIARARVHAGQGDPLDPIRVWTAAHASWTRGIAAVILGAWALEPFRDGALWRESRPPVDLAVVTVTALLVNVAAASVLYLVARAAGRVLLAPTIEAKPSRASVAKDDVTFDAVAVTQETRLAVAAMAVGNVAMAAWVATLSTHALFHERSVYGVLAAFVAVAIGGAIFFRRASTIAVGVDGVRVEGTSRVRFYPYVELDAARLNGPDIELVKGKRVVLRFQLHGEDALRRDGVLARIRTAIDHVKEGRDAVAAQMVSAASAEELARAAGGGADYRGPALTRDQLWALVEGPEGKTEARRVAADALARGSDEADRVRLRVAAEKCAAPELRMALRELADHDGAGPTEQIAARRARA
jgi:hypothetical protein